MITFIRIILVLMLKGALATGDDKSGGGNATIVWNNISELPCTLTIVADRNTLEHAINICSMYNPKEINTQIGNSNEPIPIAHVTIRFDMIKPEFQKQISERLIHHLGGRLCITWTNTL